MICFPQFEQNGGSNSEEEEEEEDVDAALKKEVAQLKASGAKQERRFQALESGANNVIFIKTHNLGMLLRALRGSGEVGQWILCHNFFWFFAEPDKLVHDILTDLHTTKKKKSRVILRMLPVRVLSCSFDFSFLFFINANKLTLFSLIFSIFPSGDWNMQSFPRGHDEIPQHFSGAVV